MPVDLVDLGRVFPKLQGLSYRSKRLDPHYLDATPTKNTSQLFRHLSVLALHNVKFQSADIGPFWHMFGSSLTHLRLILPKFGRGASAAEDTQAGVLAMLEILGERLETFECKTRRALPVAAIRLLSKCTILRLEASLTPLEHEVVQTLPATLRQLHISATNSIDAARHFLEALCDPMYLPYLEEVPFLRLLPPSAIVQPPALARVHEAMSLRGLACDLPYLYKSLLYNKPPRRSSRAGPDSVGDLSGDSSISSSLALTR